MSNSETVWNGIINSRADNVKEVVFGIVEVKEIEVVVNDNNKAIKNYENIREGIKNFW